MFKDYSSKINLMRKLPEIESAWKGHENFVYDLVRNIKPNIIVELGTHWGYSSYAMLEAIKDAKLKTKLYAVDTWEGDNQAGHYPEKVWNYFTSQISKKYQGQQVKALRMTFDEALAKVTEEIDLLHIDGLHTYEAVKNDFENWLPKMSKNGIILLHDIKETKDDFGVYKLWTELEKKYKTLQFVHSHGLGVVFLSGEMPNIEKDNYYLMNDRRLEELIDQTVKEAISYIKAMEKKDKEISDLTQCVKNHEDEIRKIKNGRLWKLMSVIARILRRKKNDC